MEYYEDMNFYLVIALAALNLGILIFIAVGISQVCDFKNFIRFELSHLEFTLKYKLGNFFDTFRRRRTEMSDERI